MKALVTGATGLIGVHIVRALIAAGHDVRCLVRTSSNRDVIDKLPVTCMVADVAQPDADLDAACRSCNTVFHTAAHYAYAGFSSDELHRTAVAGTEAVLHACARQKVVNVQVMYWSIVFGYTHDGTVTQELTVVVGADE